MRLLELRTKNIDGLHFDPTGQWLCLTSSSARVGLLDLQSARPEVAWLEISGTRFHMAAFSPGGNRLALANGHGGFVVLDLTGPQPHPIYHDETYGLSCASRSDGLILGCTSDNTGSRLRLWAWDDFEHPVFDLGHEVGRWFAHPLFLPDPKYYVAVERRDQVQDSSTTRDWLALRELHSNHLVAEVKIGNYVSGPPVWCDVTQTLFVPQNTRLRGWKPFQSESRTRSVVFHSSRNRLNWLAIHPTSPRLLTACGIHSVKVFDTRTWQVVSKLRWKIGKIQAVAFSPNGLLAAAISSSGKLMLWDFDE